MTTREGVKRTLKRNLCIGLVGMLCIGSCVPALAEADGKIELLLNQSTYKQGQDIWLSTKLIKDAAAFSDGEVLLTITQANTEKVVFVKQLLTDENGDSTARLATGDEMTPGKYRVNAVGIGTTAATDFQIVSGGQTQDVINTDKASYRQGETVRISGKLVIDGKLLADHEALIKIYCGGQLVGLKELIVNEAGEVVWDFVPSKTLGVHSIQLTTLERTYNQSFDVVKGTSERIQHQIDGSVNKTSFKGGERLKIKGTALTLKDGVKKIQGPIEVKLLLNGKVITSKPVLVASNGRFSTEILLENRTAAYEVVLINQSAEKKLEISVMKQKWL